MKSWTVLFVTNYMYYLLFIPREKQNFQDFLTFQAVEECNDFVRIAFSASQLTFESLLIRSILKFCLRDNFINHRGKITIGRFCPLVKGKNSFFPWCGKIRENKNIKDEKNICTLVAHRQLSNTLFFRLCISLWRINLMDGGSLKWAVQGFVRY